MRKPKTEWRQYYINQAIIISNNSNDHVYVITFYSKESCDEFTELLIDNELVYTTFMNTITISKSDFFFLNSWYSIDKVD